MSEKEHPCQTLGPHDIRQAFVAGASWWDSQKRKPPKWMKDYTLAEEEAEKRYGSAVCTWRPEGECWQTGCCNAFTFFDEGPEENGFRVCPYCGGMLEVGEDWE